MKGTEHFKRTIQAFLEQRAAEDELFAVNYRNPAKNIDDCVTYILNYVQKSGCNGFSDDEIFGQIVHFYDEVNIEIGKPINCTVVVNHAVELTEEEKAEARQQAIKRTENEAYAKMKQQREKATAKRTATNQQVQPSLFDF
ncbi:MAG: PcfK-like family protein [Lachnospiraceae bacterium]